MKKTMLLVTLLLFGVNAFAVRDFTCPAQIVCGTADSKTRCFVGERIGKIFVIAQAIPGYPGYIVDGTYSFTTASALDDPIKKFAPGIIQCNYKSESYPSIQMIVKSYPGYYDDLTANGTGWQHNDENKSSCYYNTPGTPESCAIMMKIPININN